MEAQDGLQHEDKCRVWDDPEFCDCGAREVDRLEKERDKYRHDYLMLEKSWQELDKENARLLQSALASQRDAEKLLEKLHAAERDNERLQNFVGDEIYRSDYRTAAGLRRAKESAEAQLAALREEDAAARRESQSLALSLHKRYYAAGSPQLELCDTVAGVITQIDNMVAGLTKK